jgi:hypothetical protein
MSRLKGTPKTGGRRPGTPNKATNDARQAIALFVEESTPRLLEWLQQVADGIPEHDLKPNPAKAIELVQGLCEYHIPKLARTEHTGKDGGAIESSVTLEIVGVAAPVKAA